MYQNSPESWESHHHSCINGVKSLRNLKEEVFLKKEIKNSPPLKKILELEKRLKDAELERDIFKKASGIFSKNGR